MSKTKFTVTVSQVNRRVALTLKNDAALADINVKGEISNFVHHYKSGHIYFTLKDSESALKCVMFSLEAEKLTFAPENGQTVIAGGRIGLYERDGSYQLYAVTLEVFRSEDEEDKKEESIYEKFLKLKETLEKDGVFSNNRQLPAYPDKICLITARDGAVLQDMLSVFARRYPIVEILLIPALVQGAGAPKSLVTALKTADNTGADLIILARGGGSAEDLWAFNDEVLAREIYKSTIPVVSAIGHETDFTIADFAADLRAPTPSAAAELTTPDLSELPFILDNMLLNLQNKIRRNLERRKNKLENLEKIINALSPEKTFARGYAAVFDKDGRAVKSSEKIEINDELHIKLANGELTVTVNKIES
ncbi:MAG: exodeoxyribonuclease VII large subunit [Oscillospiraceae bacterium]|jgi:exodeoxyribonuclease VII large subunit|nr:exodeoxyribonuclease VII large subunit [Oscillospiraceae bacterium]